MYTFYTIMMAMNTRVVAGGKSMTENMFGRVIIPYVVDDERKEVEIRFKPGFVTLHELIVEHDLEEGTTLAEVMTDDVILMDEVEYDVSLYRHSICSGNEYRDYYFMEEHEAYMSLVNEWEDLSHLEKVAYANNYKPYSPGKIADMYVTEIDLNDDSVSEGYYEGIVGMLWREGNYVDLWEYYPVEFKHMIDSIDEEERLGRMKAYYNLSPQTYEAIMNEHDPECVFGKYYRRVKAWKEGA